MNDVYEFMSAALPWIAIGLFLAVFFARWASQKKNTGNYAEYGTECMALGMCFGVALNTALQIDVGLGMMAGMLLGLIIGSNIEKNEKDNVN